MKNGKAQCRNLDLASRLVVLSQHEYKISRGAPPRDYLFMEDTLLALFTQYGRYIELHIVQLTRLIRPFLSIARSQGVRYSLEYTTVLNKSKLTPRKGQIFLLLQKRGIFFLTSVFVSEKYTGPKIIWLASIEKKLFASPGASTYFW